MKKRPIDVKNPKKGHRPKIPPVEPLQGPKHPKNKMPQQNPKTWSLKTEEENKQKGRLSSGGGILVDFYDTQFS